MTIKSFQRKLFYPLVISELYLLVTLLIFRFGPIRYRVHNETYFWIFLFSYHVAFIAGYYVGIKSKLIVRNKPDVRFNPLTYSLITVLAFASIFIALNNAGIDLSPARFSETLVKGLLTPADAYTERKNSISLALDAASASRFLNLVSVAFAFAQLFYIFYSIYFWRYLRAFRIVVFSIFSLLYLSIGISNGTNAPIFYYAIFCVTSITVTKLLTSVKINLKTLLFAVSLFSIAIIFFGSSVLVRGGSYGYIESTSPLGDISVDDQLQNSYLSFLYPIIVWLSYYIAQGYYGFSLALSLDPIFTYGFGSSPFLQRQFGLLSGQNISDLTLQYRVSDYWHHSAQWHSFYSQIANDVGFTGVILVMSILGYLMARCWKTALASHSVYAASLLPLFAILIIFMPANNQVLGYIPGVSYAVIIGFLSLVDTGRVKVL